MNKSHMASSFLNDFHDISWVFYPHSLKIFNLFINYNAPVQNDFYILISYIHTIKESWEVSKVCKDIDGFPDPF